MAMLDPWAREDFGASGYDELNFEQQTALQGRLRARVRDNTYDPETAELREN